MGLRINSNIAALSSYNNLNKTDKAVSSSLEKLSSASASTRLRTTRPAWSSPRA